jgi:hypothetical protein
VVSLFSRLFCGLVGVVSFLSAPRISLFVDGLASCWCIVERADTRQNKQLTINRAGWQEGAEDALKTVVELKAIVKF